MEVALEYRFALSYFKLSIFRFFCKNFKFSLALGASPPNHLYPSNGLLTGVLEGRPANFEKNRDQAEKLGTNRNNSLASGALPAEPLSLGNFHIFLYF